MFANVEVPLNKNIWYKNDLIKMITTCIYGYLLYARHSFKSTLCVLSQLFFKTTCEVGAIIIPHFTHGETKAQELSPLSQVTKQVTNPDRLLFLFSQILKNLSILILEHF